MDNKRGPRRMPTLLKIVAYWARRDTFEFDPDRPACFGCGSQAPEWSGSYFDRAHLVDRYLGGLDNEPNLVPLCFLCHRLQPIFASGDQAIEWVRSGGWRNRMTEILADAQSRTGAPATEEQMVAATELLARFVRM